ncbi:Predicted DNA-binding transcriptional regulator YafY, contains an HTH and WYL domains [Ruminococcus flavefaciens]|uniref:Predicted DNA-binding transcriptional regulator YafY, contains an HTH and WYL domains n=2 Tax=Ruminococcus flavefaciens TaxID=1265 RepID=A0A1M7IH20_RUMFL|nr:Predicted DNA-binding transcriptional regulator YafY, contains an HTH and WYL domains [Ruminococcus flavefaciens]
MAGSQPPKLIILDILHILQKHSDIDHRLSQQQIQDLIESEYGMNVAQKTVKRNLSKLIEFGFPIRYRGSEHENDTIIRKGKNGKSEVILTDWYYVHEFMDGELRLLIDNVLASDGISQKERLSLIGRLEGLSSKSFLSTIKNTDMEICDKVINREIYITLENIGSAIADGKQASFHYCDCGIDGKLKYKLDSSGKKKLYNVNPYQIVSRNGHSYLICNLPEHDDLTHFRIDRIKDCTKNDEPATQLRTLKGFSAGIRLSDYIKTHPNLWSGTPVHITFQCKQYMMNDVADSFGTNNRIETLPDDMMIVHVEASEASMLHWAIQFADAVEVLSPKNLREQIAETLRNALSKYEK